MAIDSRYKLKTGQEVAPFPPIQNTANPYLTEAAMHLDQANQLEGYGYLVDGVGAFTYLGTVAGTAADYEGFGGATTSVGGLKVYNVETYGAVHDGVTDDTPEIQAAINACHAAGGGIVYFPNGVYYINGALDSASNSQIYFPLSSYNSSINLVTVKLLGETSPNQFSNPFVDSGANDHTNNGVILKSNLLGTGNIIGSRDELVSWGNYNFIKVIIENMSVRIRSITGSTDVSPSATGINMGNVSAFLASHLEVCTTSKMNLCKVPNSTCYGVVMPKNNNFSFAHMTNFNMYGVYVAVDCYEHTNLDTFIVDICYIGLNFNGGNHSMHVNKGIVARSVYNIQTIGKAFLRIDNISFEDDYLKTIATPTWNATLYDVLNTGNLATGHINCHIVSPGIGEDYGIYKTNNINYRIKAFGLDGGLLGILSLTGLLAYWKFQETTGDFLDSSINTRTATRLVGTTATAGKIGNAMTLTGIAQGANAGSVGLSNTGNLTIIGWFKLNTTADAYQVLFNKGDAVAREYNCYYIKSLNKLRFINYNGTIISGLVNATFPTMGSYFFLCCEILGNTISIAVNNGPITTEYCGIPSSEIAKDLYIGNGSNIDEAVNGQVDEISMWSRQLTMYEKSYYYNKGSGNVIV